MTFIARLLCVLFGIRRHRRKAVRFIARGVRWRNPRHGPWIHYTHLKDLGMNTTFTSPPGKTVATSWLLSADKTGNPVDAGAISVSLSDPALDGKVRLTTDPNNNGQFTVEQIDGNIPNVIVNVKVAGLLPADGFSVPYTYIFTPVNHPVNKAVQLIEKTPTTWADKMPTPIPVPTPTPAPRWGR